MNRDAPEARDKQPTEESEEESSTYEEVSLQEDEAASLQVANRQLCRSVARRRLRNVDEQESYEEILSDIPRAVIWENRERVGFIEPILIKQKCEEIQLDQTCALHIVCHLDETIMDVYPAYMNPRLKLFQKIDLLQETNMNQHAIATMQEIASIGNHPFGHDRNKTFHDAGTTKELFLRNYHFALCALQDFYVWNNLKGQLENARNRIDFLEGQNENLKDEIERLKRHITQLEGEIAGLRNIDHTSARRRAHANYLSQPRRKSLRVSW